jgi:hypothetical protein
VLRYSRRNDFEQGRRPTQKSPFLRPWAREGCNSLHSKSQLLIDIAKSMVEAAGVELITMLTTRNLLILGSATTAKKAPLPDPLYVYCTKMLWALESGTT